MLRGQDQCIVIDNSSKLLIDGENAYKYCGWYVVF